MRLSPLICCGTSPLRCSAKLSWVKTATELMVDGAPHTVRVSHWSRDKGTGGSQQSQRPPASETVRLTSSQGLTLFTSKPHLTALTYKLERKVTPAFSPREEKKSSEKAGPCPEAEQTEALAAGPGPSGAACTPPASQLAPTTR